MGAMEENVRERIIILAKLISKWEIWDINEDRNFRFKTEAQRGKIYYRNGGDGKKK